MPKRTILIDGDVYAYQESISVEEIIQWEGKPGLFTLHSNVEPAEAGFNSLVKRLMKELKATDVMIAFSDPQSRNWRLNLWPDYKKHRRQLGMRKPICYNALLQRVKERWPSVAFPRLEGDDVLGWLATNPSITGEKIIVSVDKDMKTLPCAFYDTYHEVMTEETSLETAEYYHMLQTLMGDTSDGYPGCPGMGKVTAPKVLAEAENMWPAVLACFEKKGLTEYDAITQAQLARILRYQDYNIRTGQILLWQPAGMPRKEVI